MSVCLFCRHSYELLITQPRDAKDQSGQHSSVDKVELLSIDRCCMSGLAGLFGRFEFNRVWLGRDAFKWWLASARFHGDKSVWSFQGVWWWQGVAWALAEILGWSVVWFGWNVSQCV